MIKYYEIRDPIHGFIKLNDWERDIINHPIFQRLRRIRQLSLTDMVYPGAMHTRFEHSLGVMHVATKMFDEIVNRRENFLKSKLSYDDAGIQRDRVIVRLASLLHDIGHAPFSHVAESLMGKVPNAKKTYKHENYSAAAVEFLMRDVIENHPLCENYDIKARNIADFLNGASTLGQRRSLWRSLVSSQLDADRADYLLRDSHHTGVAYGNYDLNRLLVTLTVAMDSGDSPVLAIEEGGEHTAEALIIARYMMFTQVYFQRTRRIYDFHASEAMKHLLKKDTGKDVFPPPNSKENVEEYLKWDDWRVQGMLHENAGEHGKILRERNHHRCVYQTPEVPELEDNDELEHVAHELDEMVSHSDKATSSWYKPGKDIPILLRPNEADEELVSLSQLSSIVRGLKPIEQTRLYVPPAKKKKALEIVRKTRKSKEK